jgi:hypothetical protein
MPIPARCIRSSSRYGSACRWRPARQRDTVPSAGLTDGGSDLVPAAAAEHARTDHADRENRSSCDGIRPRVARCHDDALRRNVGEEPPWIPRGPGRTRRRPAPGDRPAWRAPGAVVRVVRRPGGSACPAPDRGDQSGQPGGRADDQPADRHRRRHPDVPVGVTEDQAFAVLSKHSQDHNVKVRDLADEVIYTGSL